jgi:hypothetical protein
MNNHKGTGDSVLSAGTKLLLHRLTTMGAQRHLPRKVFTLKRSPASREADFTHGVKLRSENRVVTSRCKALETYMTAGSARNGI